MNVTRHFSDTRTSEGRVRFLLRGARVLLLAEGPGWRHDSTHVSLDAAARFLATLGHVSEQLYAQALADLEGRLALEREYERTHAA